MGCSDGPSDFPVSFSIEGETPKINPTVKFVRNYNDIDMDDFRNDLTNNLPVLCDQNEDLNHSFYFKHEKPNL